MTELVMNYTVNPLASFWRGCQRSLLIAGHVRAAAELSRQGYHQAAKQVMTDLKELKNNR